MGLQLVNSLLDCFFASSLTIDLSFSYILSDISLEIVDEPILGPDASSELLVAPVIGIQERVAAGIEDDAEVGRRDAEIWVHAGFVLGCIGKTPASLDSTVLEREGVERFPGAVKVGEAR